MYLGDCGVIEQDDVLDSMYESVKNTSGVAKAIGEEADVHIGLLDDISASAARNDGKLRNATAAAHEVEITSSTKVLWLVIILLIITFIILLIFTLKNWKAQA